MEHPDHPLHVALCSTPASENREVSAELTACNLLKAAAMESLGLELHGQVLEQLVEAIYLEGKRDAIDQAISDRLEGF